MLASFQKPTGFTEERRQSQEPGKIKKTVATQYKWYFQTSNVVVLCLKFARTLI